MLLRVMHIPLQVYGRLCLIILAPAVEGIPDLELDVLILGICTDANRLESAAVWLVGRLPHVAAPKLGRLVS